MIFGLLGLGCCCGVWLRVGVRVKEGVLVCELLDFRDMLEILCLRLGLDIFLCVVGILKLGGLRLIGGSIEVNWILVGID